jgi:hypothetical protein
VVVPRIRSLSYKATEEMILNAPLSSRNEIRKVDQSDNIPNDTN